MRIRATVALAVLFVLGIMGAMNVEPAPAGNHQADDFEIQVVRAYFGDDINLVNELANWTEPWDVNQTEGYLIVEVDSVGYQRLLDMGFQVEVDLTLTAQYNDVRVALPGQGGGIPGYECYRTVEETFTSATDMVTAYPNLVSWTDIGDSWDKLTPGGPAGYDIMALRLTNQAIPGPKPTLYIFGALHAREYTTAEMVTRFAEHMLANYDIDPDITWLLDHHQIDIILQANPDGRKIAETGSSWRKNTNNSDGCLTGTYGVDLNRNFEFYWNTGGSSGDCSSLIYRGSSAASEPETQALQDYAYTLFPDQREDPITATAPITTTGIFLDVHSFSEEILWPWGFTTDPPPNGTGMETLARKMGYFNGYDATQSLYTTSGSTKDFMYGEFGVPGYTIELGTTFFQSCTVFEDTIYPDNLPMLIYAAKASRYAYITPAGPDSLTLTLSDNDIIAGNMVDLTATIDDTRYNNSQGTEPSQNIIMAEYYIDTPDWLAGATPLAMTASDGNFNNTVEAVEATIDTTGLSAGRHTIFVRGQDATGNWGAYSAIFLNISPDLPPLANFTASDMVAPAGTPINFSNTSSGTNLSYEWDFGDGSPINTDTNPTHTFTAPGMYTVTLTTTNPAGSDTHSLTIEIYIESYLPIIQQP